MSVSVTEEARGGGRNFAFTSAYLCVTRKGRGNPGKVVGGIVDGLLGEIFEVCKGELFKAWHTCLGAIQAFLLWQRGATEGFP